MALILFFLIKFASLSAFSQELPQGVDKAAIKAGTGSPLIKMEEMSILKEKLEEQLDDEAGESKKAISGPSNLDILSQLENENVIQNDLLNTVDESFLLEESSLAGDPSPLGENWGTLKEEMNEPGLSAFAPIGTDDSSAEFDTPVVIDWTTTQIKGTGKETEITPSSTESSSYFPIIPD